MKAKGKENRKPMPAPPARPPRDYKPLLQYLAVGAVLAVLILLAWSDSFAGAFVFDNRFMILLDSRVRAATGENLGLILNHSYWATKYDSGLYRPVTTLSYLFNYAVLGGAQQPAGYHAFNIFLHILNSFLVYALALRFLRKLWPAAFVAAVWALHPVLTEAVTNIVGRADLLAAMAVLAGFLMYLRSTEASGWRKLPWLLGVTAATTVGVFSKESAVVILGVIALYEATWWSERKQWRGLLFGCAALLPPFLLLWYQRSVVLTSGPPLLSLFPDNPIVAASFVRGRLTALAVMAKCLWLFLWPLRLSPDYSYGQIPLVTGALREWLAWAALLALLVAAAALFKRSRAAFFFIGFGFVSFLPVSNLMFPTGTIMAERVLYMPAIGFAACLVLVVFRAGRALHSSAFAPAILCVILAAFGARTWERNLDWRDNLALWTSAVRAVPDSYKAHLNLASAINDLNPDHPDSAQVNRMTAETDTALAILDPLPDSLNAEPAYTFGGEAYMIKGDLLQRLAPAGQTAPESRAAYEKALAILNRGVAIDRAFNENYRREELARGRVDSEIAPAGFESLYYSLAAADIRLGKNDDAATAAARAATLSPQYTEAYTVMGAALSAENRKEEAAIALMQGLLISGDEKFLPLLRSAYQGGIDTKACSFTAGSRYPNPSCEIVHSDICKASARLIKLLLDARQQPVASDIKSKAVEDSGCSPAELK